MKRIGKTDKKFRSKTLNNKSSTTKHHLQLFSWKMALSTTEPAEVPI